MINQFNYETKRLTGVSVILFILTAKSALLLSQIQQIDASEYNEK
jgi:hypothetical protein